MLSGPILLEGAPDTSIGTPEAKAKAVQVMQLEMSNDVLEELLESVRRGKQPSVVFGKIPMIRYDGRSQNLHPKAEKFRNELYCSSQDDAENEWAFSGLIYHSLEMEKIEEASAGVDKALETLHSHMASIKQQREAQKLKVDSTPEMRAMKGGPSKAKSRASHFKPLTGSSLPTSPALGASSPYLAPPTSAGLDSNMPHEVAIKKAVVHFLAVKPRTQLECRRVVGTNTSRVMERYAKKTGEEKWTLLDRLYKDLDIWNFQYRHGEEREAAKDNAIRAYDRMRLSKDDPHWDKLLPKEERGQGTVLSRLNLSKAPLKGTPVVKPKTIDKKTGLPRRTEVKKTDKEGAKAKKKETSEEEIKVAKTKADVRTPKPNGTPKPHGSTKPDGTPKVDATKDRKGGKREKEKEGDRGSAKPRKDAKPSTAAKSLLNKPRNPSPLSKSPPVNATDFEDDHPIHKALSAAVSPKRNNNNHTNGDAHHRSNGVKRKALDMDSDTSKSSTPAKQRRVNGTNGITNGHRSPPSDNSSGSPPLALSWRQSIDLAKKFRQYYDRYAKLYMELSNSAEPPSQAKRDQLLNMHRKLEEMKKEVRSGAL
ncbi:hypothetical protein EJ08DRAFT_703410 [Tothia fuscella]|uniref:Uncharacterized protein n=1 Tax=Tothia fuscella TaxID=1048955 RepID=A0A9P4NEN8_9PEZI|nr:hypothetical protein EJ08DRAFT_703410 [Tothia fuscella]